MVFTSFCPHSIIPYILFLLLNLEQIQYIQKKPVKIPTIHPGPSKSIVLCLKLLLLFRLNKKRYSKLRTIITLLEK